MARPRGVVLLQVLVTAVVVSVIAAGLVRMLMLRYTITTKQARVNAKIKQTEGFYNRLLAHWADPANGFCSSPPTPPGAPAIVCDGNQSCASGPVGCECSVGGVAARIRTTGGTFPNCTFAIDSDLDDL